MNQAKPFLEAFPGLDVDPKIRALLEYVKVERITVNHARNRLKIYIVSENWLKKQTKLWKSLFLYIRRK